MPRAAVLGRPIAHSLSPVLHRAAYAALGLTDWSYAAIDCGEDDLAPLLATRDASWRGFSCTMPLKRTVVEVANEVSELAGSLGVGNTLIRTATGWRAENTDAAGIIGALADSGVKPHRVVILGAGGTAVAALAALTSLGIRHVTVLVREPSRTGALAAAAERLGIGARVLRFGEADPAAGFDLVISTLPAGAADEIAGRMWTAATTLLDVVYDPWPTRLATAVTSAGGRVISGALMLLHQAVGQVELMTGQPAPTDALRAALRAATPSALA